LSLLQGKTHKNTFSGHAAGLFLARLFPALALFICWIAASHQLQPDAYGAYQSFWIQLNTLAAIASLGYPTFIFNHSGPQVLLLWQSISRQKILLYAAILIGVASLFGWLQRASCDSVTAGLSLVAWVIGIFCEATLLALYERKRVVTLNVLYAMAMVGIHLVLLQNGYGLHELLQAIFLILLLKAFGNLALLRNSVRMSERNSEEAAITDYQKQWRQFAINDTVQVLFRWIDKFILSFLLSGASFAVYVNASIDIPFLPILFSAVAGAAVQHWVAYPNSNTDNKLQVLHHASALLAALIFPLFAFLMAFRESFLTVVFSEHYLSGVNIFVCAQLVLPLRAYPFTSLLQSHKRADIITRGAIIDFVMACLLMYPLYRLFGLPGVAISFVISTYWQAIYYLKKTKEVTGYSFAQLFPVKQPMILLLTSLTVFFGTILITEQLQLSMLATFIVGLLLLFVLAGVGLLRAWREK
jgi:O-antigen/teichoic acid export membrane protein